MYILRTEQEWHIATDRSSLDESRVSCKPSEHIPDDLAWSRWTADDETDLRMEPISPDRPVVSRPDASLSIPPRKRALIYIGVPIWIRLTACGKQETVLTEVPTVTLSNTWFGSAIEGQLCYSLKTTAKRTVDDLHIRPYRAVCPMSIRNRSDEMLTFERLCIQSQYLNIYSGRDHLWTNAGRASYRGEAQWSRVVFGHSAPNEDAKALLAGEAREVLPRGFFMKTFSSIKSMVEE